ncbi:MAG TPA: UDP-N-acetylglucosamine--N-acetylmuramyl-(pentapeptide) pyrophosphoryl-undecaprenol N-acetylglucosamine transferase [Candidatus Saccharimonadales bacterium]|nr:UDP-N-acetylglucosamine--N-acetylmuramyl-(pentapeptide) pyrophosphoryl-undecaprenol N-acetylglucosamine transferase [Candidatus Saccharimonadales bacterium]
MKIVMTGGGSGGHITPILAVAHELKRQDPNTQIIYIGQKGDHLSDVPAADPSIDSVYEVSAGKLRRYADEGWKQWLNVRVQILNMRDACRVVAGLWQSFWLLHRLKPDVIFTRGGFVSVPVALGGRLNGIPYITHDSDSVPSLANRLIARWAQLHAVALPAALYPYPAAKTVVVGVPVNAQYQAVTPRLRAHYRAELDMPKDAEVIFVTGGGNGARVLNEALVANARYLLGTFPNLVIVHIAGRMFEAETNQAYDALQLGATRKHIRVHGFTPGLAAYSGAADVVVTRGGATTLAEFAVQGVACLIVPSKQLGWNIKNAQILADQQAALLLNEDQIEQPERLGRTIGELLSNQARCSQLAHNLSAYAHPHAAVELAELILKVAGGEEGHVRAKK